jgi:hypothetical protein
MNHEARTMRGLTYSNSYKWATKRAGEEDVIRFSGDWADLAGTPITYRTKSDAEAWCIRDGEVVVKAADYPAYVSGHDE